MMLEDIQKEISRFIETYVMPPNTIVITVDALYQLRKELPFPVDTTAINTIYGLAIIIVREMDYCDYKICLCA